MFKSASFRLTMAYLAILMVVSVTFSAALYATSTHEYGRSLRRAPYPAYDFNQPYGLRNSFEVYRDQRLTAAEKSLITDLVGFNLIVLILGGAASYWLAKRTLQPIEEAMEAQSRFTADASHELRTPLTSMRTEIEVALRGKKLSDKEARELLESNLEEVKKLEALSSNLLRLAQSSGDHLTSEWEHVDLAKLVTAAISRVKPQAHARNITIESEVAGSAQGIASSLTELLVILLDNAVKYGVSDSTVKITSNSQDGHVVISVEDRGAGIKAADIPHIFDRFYRVDSSRSKQVEGYGLGLSIAKQIVELHNGEISVTSKPNEATIFSVRLPIKQPS